MKRKPIKIIKVRPIPLSFHLDLDRDGVFDKNDCRPFDPRKQHIRGDVPEDVTKYIKDNPSFRETAHRMDLVHLGSEEGGWTTTYHKFGIVPLKEEFVPKEERDYRGETITYGKKKGTKSIPRKAGLIYRGMSWQEYQNSLKRGYFKSRGGYNIGASQKGATCASRSPEQAMSYASWFTPFPKTPTPEEPGVVVAFEENALWEGNNLYTGSSNEVQRKGIIPLSEMEEVYVFQMEKFIPGHMEIIKDAHGMQSGSRSGPRVEGTWRRIK